MRPTPEISRIVLGVLGRAQRVCRRFGRVRLHAFVFMSGHYHLLVSVDDARQLSAFMQHLNGNLSYKLNDFYQRRGTLWERRFRAIPVTPDEATQRWRLRYLLAHGVKENLVGKVSDWTGASSLPWMLDGKRLRGTWTSLTRRWAAMRRKHRALDPTEYETEYEIELEVLPCWNDLPVDTWRSLVRKMVREIEAEFQGVRGLDGSLPAGIDWVLSRDPWSRSVRRLKKSREEQRAPLVHAVRHADRTAWVAYLRSVRSDYVAASRAYRAGDWEARFPPGTFRPGGGFVPQRGPVPLSVIAG